MLTASFVRAIERFAGDPYLHFLPLFQWVVAIRKTCNQLKVKGAHGSASGLLLCLRKPIVPTQAVPSS
jgi:hypothetical protein